MRSHIQYTDVNSDRHTNFTTIDFDKDQKLRQPVWRIHQSKIWTYVSIDHHCFAMPNMPNMDHFILYAASCMNLGNDNDHTRLWHA